MYDFDPDDEFEDSVVPLRWWWLVAGAASLLAWALIIWLFVAIEHGAFS